jgi:ferritin
MKKEIETILNAQVDKEGYSSHLYLSMASWAENQGFEGIANWLYAQSEEERTHMLKFVKYINERGGKAVIAAVEAPPSRFENVQTLFQAVLEHEEYITLSINNIANLCAEFKDFTTQNWLQWFINEQIEEERNARQILDKLKLIGEGSLYLFDRDIMSLRTAKPQAPNEAENA